MDEPPSPRPRRFVRWLVVASACLVLIVVMSGCGSNIVDLPTAQPAVVQEPVATFAPLAAAPRGASATPLPPSPTASATPLVFPTPTPIIYTVQPRDTLNALAVHFGVSLEQLMSANGLTDPNFLQLGQQLIIPVVAPPVEGLPVVAQVGGVATAGAGPVNLAATDGANVLHYVRVGETLSVIANLYAVDLRDLLMANGLAPDSQLVSGQTLLIPKGVYTPVPTVTPVIPDEVATVRPTAKPAGEAASDTSAPVQAPVPTPLVHEVQPGEVPAGIALHYGVSVEALLAANPGVVPSALYPGDKLVIPVPGVPLPAGGIVQATPTLDPEIFTTHTIQASDTITDLYAKYSMTYQQLTAYNNIRDPNHLEPGAVLYVLRPRPTATATPIPEPTIVPTALPAHLPPMALLPAEGSQLVRGRDPVMLSWAATELLGPNEYYVVQLQIFDAGENLVNVVEAWTQTTSWRVPDEELPAEAGSYRLQWELSIQRQVTQALTAQLDTTGAEQEEPQLQGIALSGRSQTMSFYLTVRGE